VTSIRIPSGGSSKSFFFKGATAGSVVVTVAATNLRSASQTETIKPAAPKKLVFAAQPSNVLAGSAIAPAVAVKVADSLGYTVNSPAMITLSIGTNPGAGTLSGTLSVAAVNGVATFGNVRVDTAGAGYTLVASSSAVTSATSAAFNVTSTTPPSGGDTSGGTGGGTGTGTGTSLRPLPDHLYGITLDAVDHLPDILTSLRSLARMPTTRIVFDEFVAPSYYATAVSAIHDVSYVMGEILDSFYMKQYTLADYSKRTTDYLNALGDKVDIWEIGNEINGEWLGDTASVVAKMRSAYDLVKQRGGRTALTLYYNQDCWSRADHEMFTWTAANVPADMKQGLDYVLISYYEDDCNGLQPDWTPVFQKLAAMFPNSKIGFGENGTQYAARKAAYIERYYSMDAAMAVAVPSYIGGHFWWYGKQDFVPWTNPLWTIFNDVIK
jgi:hypothetical protein